VFKFPTSVLFYPQTTLLLTSSGGDTVVVVGWTVVGWTVVAMIALSAERARRAPQKMVCSLTIWKIGKIEIYYNLSS
jgi:hypothetical protein